MTFKYAKRCCFTLNNWTEDDVKRLVVNGDMVYICYGKEIAPSTGTKHLQGYCEFSRKVTLKQAKKYIGEAHLSTAKGNQKQNKEYCSKGGDFFEQGTPIMDGQGKRTDIEEKKRKIKEGVPMIELISTCTNFQQIRMVEKLYEYKPLSAEYKKKEVYWFWGTTGTGKTRTAYDMIKELKKDFWVSTSDGAQWMNGYWGQPIALLDEVRAQKWPYATLLRLLDGYELRVPFKGGFTIWNPEVVIITSPRHPEKCYEGQLEFGDGHIDQLLRRITEIREFKEEKEVVVPEMFDSPETKKRKRETAFLDDLDEELFGNYTPKKKKSLEQPVIEIDEN